MSIIFEFISSLAMILTFHWLEYYCLFFSSKSCLFPVFAQVKETAGNVDVAVRELPARRGILPRTRWMKFEIMYSNAYFLRGTMLMKA